MNQVIHSKIIKMGNTFGIRIPRTLLDQAGLRDEVDLMVEGGRLVIRAAKTPDEGETKLLEETIFAAWDDDGWS